MLVRLTTRLRHCSLAVVIVALSATAGFGLAACGADAKADTTASTAQQTTSTGETATGATTTGESASGAAAGDGNGFFDSSQVREISVSFSQEDYDAMIKTYQDSGAKDWIKATVTIEGVALQEVGMRLKGNSSIMGLRNGNGGAQARGPGGNVSADSPQTLPWLIRLDKYVDGQNYNGLTDLVVRSNTSTTSLNEAVALELLDIAGLDSLKDVMCAFSVNGGAKVARLVTQLPNDEWMQEHFGSTGALYKAEASGDYSYRGDDPDSYANVFDQEAGKNNTDLTPLIGFLEFINNSDDATFAAELPKRLDVDAFATYLAMEELLGNFDDIDGPGNNSYLYYDPATGMFTIVPWDHNLAFGAMNRGPGGGQAPAVQTQPSGQAGVGGAGWGTTNGGAANDTTNGGTIQGQNAGRQPGQGMMAWGKSNILVTRFHANTEFQALYEKKVADLRTQLYASGNAQTVLDKWVEVLKTQASDLLDSATIDQEAAKIAAYFSQT